MKKLNKYFERFYRLSIMRELGSAFIIGITIMLAFVVVLQFIDFDKSATFPTEQSLNVETNHIVNNDQYFHHFLRTIKSNNGVLVLGTSETGSMDNMNYWGLLNSDKEIDTKFSAFAGAGRFCEMYFPLIVSNPKEWENLEILVFVNPTYWRVGLNQINPTYQNRYLKAHVFYNARPILEEHEIFEPYFGEVFGPSGRFLKEQFNYITESKIRKKAFELFASDDTQQAEDFIPFPNVIGYNQLDPSNYLDSVKSVVNTKFNCLESFIENGEATTNISVIDTASQYRFDALKTMFDLCEKYKIKATYVLGPYNNTLAQQKLTKTNIDEYEKLIDNIKLLFRENEQNIIDCTEISYIPNTFSDGQHHSQYGGYLIYEKIKAYYEKK